MEQELFSLTKKQAITFVRRNADTRTMDGKMKAYTAQNEEGYNEIVFAETASQAKALLLSREYFKKMMR